VGTPVTARFALLSCLAPAVLLTGCDLAFPIHDGPEAGPTGVGDGGDGGAADAPSVVESSCDDDGAVTGSYPAEVMKDGPAVYLRLGEDAGPVAHDQTHHYDGAYPDGGIEYGVTGAILGDSDTAVRLDGTAPIAMPAGLDFAGRLPFTLEAWANEAPGNGFGWVFDHSDWLDSGTRVSWNFYLNDGTGTGMTLERREADGLTAGSVVGAGSPYPLGVYHHAVATFDGTTLALYLDGKQVALTGTGGTDLPATGNVWTIGGQNCACSDRFIGVLDELAVYPTALAADRVCAHYRASGRP
jgi:concanavalin A-like lectin/glucanase superfamily protein